MRSRLHKVFYLLVITKFGTCRDPFESLYWQGYHAGELCSTSDDKMPFTTTATERNGRKPLDLSAVSFSKPTTALGDLLRQLQECSKYAHGEPKQQ